MIRTKCTIYHWHVCDDCLYTSELAYDGLNGTRKIGPSYAKSVCMYVCINVCMYVNPPSFILRAGCDASFRVPREVPTLIAHLAVLLDRAIEIA